jgi:DNA-binding NarL/FixJ family response regulator
MFDWFRRKKRKSAGDFQGPRRALRGQDLQVEILRLTWECGLTNAEIGEIFGLTASGVRNHLSRLYRTLGVHSCQMAIKEAVARGMLAPAKPQSIAEAVALEVDEVTILEMVRDGRASAEIASALSIAGKTLRNRLSRVHRKLGVHSRIAAMRKAIEMGLIEPEGKE